MNDRYEDRIRNDEIYSELESEGHDWPAGFESSETDFHGGLHDDWADDDDILLYDDVLSDGTLSFLLR